MGKINQVAVNGQNYEIEDKVARNYYPDTKQSAAVAEENSYKIVDKNGNTIAEFKSDSDISIMLGGDEENAILKLTKNKVIINNNIELKENRYISFGTDTINQIRGNNRDITVGRIVQYYDLNPENNGYSLFLGRNNKYSDGGEHRPNNLILGDSNYITGIQNAIFGKNNKNGNRRKANYTTIFGNNNIINAEKNFVIGENIDDADSPIAKRIILGYPVYFDVSGKTLQQRLDDLEKKVDTLEKK